MPTARSLRRRFLRAFLTLLVTEMQNQDPTAQTDPNEYINQLVGVNSLEQLIGINQTLTGAFGAQPTKATNHAAGGPEPSGAGAPSDGAGGGMANAPAVGEPIGLAPGAVGGNLNIPDASAAAIRVAQALNGQPHAEPFAVRGSALR